MKRQPDARKHLRNSLSLAVHIPKKVTQNFPLLGTALEQKLKRNGDGKYSMIWIKILYKVVKSKLYQSYTMRPF